MRYLSFLFWRRSDLTIITVVVILITIGLAAIYSVDISRGAALIYFPTQMLATALGMGVLIIAASFHASVWQSLAKMSYLVALGLLGAVLVFGQNIRGTTGWFRVAGFSFQPAEFAKIALILFLALFISYQGRRFDRLVYLIFSAGITGVPAGLIMLQPDLGSAVVLMSIWFGLFCFTVTKPRFIFLVIGIGLVASVLAWMFLFKTYQKERLSAFVHPNSAECAKSECYNVRQSLIAIGSGQLFGRGLGFGSQSQLHFLPEAQTDFIFSVIAEELGFVGLAVLLLLYLVLLWRLTVIARTAHNDFGTFTVCGILILFFVQLVFNVGAATGMLPVTGLTLPFVSYGGSSLMMNCLLIGIVESIARSRPSMTDLHNT
jgi:rod shape determining protein RodA